MITDKRLVVAIATAKRAALLERTLASIAAAARPSKKMEVVVVENGSQAGAEGITQQFQERLAIRYLYSPIANKSAALNKVLSTYSNCLIIFFDDDVRIGKETLRAYEEVAGDKGSGAFYGGPIQPDYESPPPAWLTPFLPRSASGWSLGNEVKELDLAFGGGNWAAFSEDLRLIGGFPTDVGPGALSDLGEDTLVQERLRTAGCKGYYVPQASVAHFVPKSRCNPKWALERAHREGRYCAYDAGIPEVTWFGCPRWIWRELLKVGAKRLIKTFSFDRATRFSGRYSWAFTAGKVSGFRQLTKQSQ